ncbi:helix-turn-helix transcriptional regulator [Pseudoduganella umbonata]|uniref:Helix-turn-helix domain-containing protein n=1 Tax=Pseudoduganella umbonata TaxID=864828 RepID=A0A4P8HNR8_9BURK|nr:helix-turn-helix transcriptional regulator [Pseudoduganella umbonata]MBB3224276.1 transcriptional regulator with XRE-family HTH domain [Pseudoduganella umbonata]QCP11343.1 helix-turn-helix domain-containing protein [Pseudoduganella umbonata]
MNLPATHPSTNSATNPATAHQPDPRRLLGAFIRAHRERLPPPAKAFGRRRTPGLRREELADAAGVSATWITWLEQGREVAASAAALARLADALRLTSAERASMFDLAQKRDPAPAKSQAGLPGDLLALPSLFTGPAYLLDRTWTVRAWNPAAARLFSGWLDDEAGDRNLMRFVFLAPLAQALIADWPERSRRLVAEFRADFSRCPHEPAMLELIDDLSANSPLFSRCWKEQAVLHREGGERTFKHPADGMLRFLQTTLLVASQQECKLVCLAPM